MNCFARISAAGTLILGAGLAHSAVTFEVDTPDGLGSMFVANNVARFLPTQVMAKAVGGPSIMSLTDLTILKITSDDPITSINYSARGDYINLVDFGSPIEGTGADGQLNYDAGATSGTAVMDVIGLGVTSTLLDLNQPWSESALVTFDITDNVTQVFLSIQSDLVAAVSGPLELAKIQKKLVEIEVSALPLPAAAWLFLGAIAGVFGVGRLRTDH